MLNTFSELQENFQLCYIINLLQGEYHHPRDVNRIFLNVRRVLFLCFQKESLPSCLVRDCEVALTGSSYLSPSCPPSECASYGHAFTCCCISLGLIFSAFSVIQNHEVRKSLQQKKIYAPPIFPISHQPAL